MLMMDIGGLLDEIALATGALFLAIGLAAFRRTRRFIGQCRSAEGRIADYITEESDDGVYYFSRIRFRDASMAEHEVRGSSGLQRPPTVGEIVQLTYDPAHPTNAWVTGTAAPWVIPWFILLVGLALVVAGFVVQAEGG